MRVLDIAKMVMKWSGINENTAVVVWVFMIEIFNREGFEYYAGVSNSTQAVVYNIILLHTGRPALKSLQRKKEHKCDLFRLKSYYYHFMRQIFLFDKNVVFADNACIFPVIAIAHVITL